MNTISIATHPNYDTSGAARRMAEREAEEVVAEAERQAKVDKLRDTVMEVITMDRELDRLMDLTDEDLFGGAA